MNEMLDLNGSTILVTGGAGMIGSYTVDLLLRDYSCTVRIFDNLSKSTHPEGRPPWLPAQCEFIEADMRDRPALLRALSGVDYVFHLAAVGQETKSTCLADLVSANCVGSATLFDTIKSERLPVKKIVVASSMGVYGPSSYMRPDGSEYIGYTREASRMAAQQYETVDDNGVECARAYPVKETRALLAEYPYSQTKLVQEKLALWAGKELGIPTVALRYSITHGARQSPHNPYTGVISFFATQILNGKAPAVYEDGLQTRDFMYASDVAAANVTAMRASGANGRALNVGSGREPATMMRVAKFMCNHLGTPGMVPRLPGQFRPFDARHIALDGTELRKLGWKGPEVSVEEGLRMHCDWMRKEHESRAGGLEDRYSAIIEKQVASGDVKSVRPQQSKRKSEEMSNSKL